MRKSLAVKRVCCTITTPTITNISVVTEDGFSRFNNVDNNIWGDNSFDVNIVNEEGKRNYTTTVTYTDEAGNINESVLDVRYNIAPDTENITCEYHSPMYDINAPDAWISILGVVRLLC